MEYELVRPLGDNLYELHPSGWHSVDLPRALVQVERRGGRAYLTSLVVLGTALDTETLKAIPIARVESLLNHPDLARHQEETDAQPITTALARLLERTEPGAASRRAVRRSRRKPLGRPDGSDPDGFYSKVADAYNDAIRTTAKPAPLLAAEADVPVPTVHRWIAEARRRGFLPPARKGRAG